MPAGCGELLGSSAHRRRDLPPPEGHPPRARALHTRRRRGRLRTRPRPRPTRHAGDPRGRRTGRTSRQGRARADPATSELSSTAATAWSARVGRSTRRDDRSGPICARPIRSCRSRTVSVRSDWAGWAGRGRLGDRLQLVGDDLFVTNVDFLQRGHRRRRRQRDPRQGQPDRHPLGDARRTEPGRPATPPSSLTARARPRMRRSPTSRSRPVRVRSRPAPARSDRVASTTSSCGSRRSWARPAIPRVVGISARSIVTARRRTKIVATIGPASSSPEMLAALIEADGRRPAQHVARDACRPRARAARVREAEEAAGRPIALIADLQGPKLRVEISTHRCASPAASVSSPARTSLATTTSRSRQR